MNIIDKAALSLARKIHENYPQGSSEAVLKYSLSLLINTFSAIVIVLLICLFTGHIAQACVVIAAFTALRYFSGGLHMSSSVACCTFSVICFAILSHIQFNYDTFRTGVVLNLAAIVILLKTAPKGIENVSSVDPKYYPVLKLISVLVVASNFVIQSSVLSAVFIVQACLTTEPAYKIVNFIERRASRENCHR